MERVLKAEESLRRVTENALGFGLMPKHESELIRSAWRRDAQMATEKKGPTRLGELTGNGAIGIEVVEKSG